MTLKDDPTRWHGQVQVTVPKDRHLAELLHGSGGTHEQLVHEMHLAADPGSGRSSVVMLLTTPRAAGHVPDAEGVRANLGVLLEQADRNSHPGATSLGVVVSQLDALLARS